VEKNNKNDMVKVIIVDDHIIINEGVRKVLTSSGKINVVFNANKGQDVLELIKKEEVDIVITDLMMPEMNGFELFKKIREYNSNIKVVILTAVEDNFYINKAISYGLDGFLSKRISPKELIEAIIKVNQGEKVLSSCILKCLDENCICQSDELDKVVSITKREHDILAQIADGKTNQEIAELLFLSKRTVEAHRYNIMQKLNIKNSAELMKYSIKYTQLF